MTEFTAGPAPASLAQPVRGYSGTLIAACAAVFASQAMSTLPASLNGLLQSDLRITGNELTWITSAFMVAVVVFEFTFGVLGDMYGRKKLVLAGAGLAVVGNAVCALAPTVQVLWAGAAINGLAAGAMFPGSLSLVAAITHTADQRSKAVAMWAGALSLAAFVAPMAGGIISGGGNWRASYWFLLAVAVGAGVLTSVLAVESSAPEGRSLDVPGQITFAIGLFAVLFGIIQGPAMGWTSPLIVGAFVGGVLLLAAFFVIERRAASPILELRLFRNRAFAVTSLVSIVGMFAFLGIGFSVSIWLGPIQHQNPAMIGLVYLLMQGPAFVLVPLIAKLLRTVNPAWLLASGWTLLGIAALLYMRLDVHDLSFGPLVVPTLIAGFGFALTVSSMTAVAVNTVPLHLVGMASATINMIRDLGFALGPAIIGTVAMTAAAGRIVGGLQTSGLIQDPAVMGAFTAGGPFALNSPGMPAPVQTLALESLAAGYVGAYVVIAVAAFAAAVLTVVGMWGVDAHEPAADALYDDLHPGVDSAPVVDVTVPIHPGQFPATQAPGEHS